MNMSESARWRLALARHEINKRIDHALLWTAARLPHRLTCWVLAHVAAATLRGDENAADARFMDLNGRWTNRELQGNAAKRHARSHVA